MAAVITRANHPDFLYPGILTSWGLSYDKFPDIWSQIFDTVDGSLQTEYLVASSGFGLARVKTESAPVTYDSDAEDYVTKVTPSVIALGFQVTQEELEDNLYEEIAMSRADSLAFSMHTTIEIDHANLFLNGFSSSVLYGDNQPLFSASHPTKSGLQSNVPLVYSNLSEASLEDALISIYQTKNSRGLNISLQAKKLLISSANVFNANRILASQLRSGSANNDINSIKNLNLLPEGALVNPYFGMGSKAWYIQTNIPEDKGFLSIWRREPTLERDNEFDTQNMKCRSTARYAPTVADWRAGFGNAGS